MKKKKKTLYYAVKVIVVEIEGERVEVPFDQGYITTAHSECECCGSSDFVAFVFTHKDREYEVVLRDT